jgi:hypothetical protein
MHTFFYAVWLGIPLIFFLLALWSKLEALSGRQIKDRPDDISRQGIFLLFCALIAIGIDYYLLDAFYANFSPDWIPLGFYKVVLLPIVFVIAGKIIGPTKDIMISKYPKPSERKKK